MRDFFAPSMPVDILQSPVFRVVPVLGDAMYPTLRGDHDYVLMKPVTKYAGEGIYVLDNGIGIDFYRAESTMDETRQIRLFRDNPAYRDRFMTIAQFEARVLGIVVADIKVRNGRLLASA
ncbi:S24 family peptidase [Phyllobacterium leguminum]|uniref:Uncharacterized protein n=1 Tax=Phyllobacterium leguminum TaxID=314237 RepID=A0A318T894_9HYPH|nr:S24 family peptidase [Phyllobacterium leguminum]PYE89628.1 hypothetical protein C7477_103136 [Phyllobacterium leguminum]